MQLPADTDRGRMTQMLSLNELVNMQLMMFLLMAIGVFFRKKGIISEDGMKNMTDFFLDIVLPANIVKSFLIEFGMDTLMSFLAIVLVSMLIQIFCSVFGKLVYNWVPLPQRKVLQYGTVCSNAGLIGNVVAQEVFGSIGMTLASIFLIPQRIVMWTVGLAFFTDAPDKKTLIRKVITNPCIVAVGIGLVLMFSGIQLPVFLEKTINSLSACTTGLSMVIIGTILAQVDYRKMVDGKVVLYTFFRLLLIPALVYAGCRLAGAEKLVTNVSVILAAMPAGSTTAILAMRYDGDAEFATKLVVFSTIMSLGTTVLWCMVL